MSHSTANKESGLQCCMVSVSVAGVKKPLSEQDKGDPRGAEAERRQQEGGGDG